ncbi:MAG: hypothetical protein WC055_15730 [Melioribacteraceae bacterium]
MKSPAGKKFKNNNLFLILFSLAILIIIFVGLLSVGQFFPTEYNRADAEIKKVTEAIKEVKDNILTFDTKAYDAKMLQLANYPAPKVSTTTAATSTATATATTTPVKPNLWPVKTAYPKAGALLPFNRIIAYYGNFYSTKMGVLGEYSEEVVIQKLRDEMAKWKEADPTTPTVPAINYIAITAQGTAQPDGKYRLRMPDSQIDIAVSLAKKVDGIVILDIQIGLSDLKTELPLLEKYLKMPNVHLGLDPEFAMHNGQKPGDYVGSFDAAEINYTANYLAKLVKDNDLPPKVLIVHRFTEDMVTNYKKITPLPEVQIVMDMDGWGSQARKFNTYRQVIQLEPVQFTGFKLFYKNDFREPGSRILTPAEIMELQPRPSFIQYQ